MKNLLNLLERFSKVLNKDTLTKEAIAKVVEEKTKVHLARENFTLKDTILEISSGSSAKNEIRLKEDLIKDELKNSHQILVSRIFYK